MPPVRAESRPGSGSFASVWRADRILNKGLSVRQSEEVARRLTRNPQAPSRRTTPDQEALRSIEDTLKRSLGTKVELRRRGRRGHITIHFYSDEELDRLLERLS